MNKSEQIILTTKNKSFDNLNQRFQKLKNKKNNKLNKWNNNLKDNTNNNDMNDNKILTRCDNELKCERRFRFDKVVNPLIFSHFDGYVINNKLYLFNDPVSMIELNKHILMKHGMRYTEKNEYVICQPTTIDIFSIKPHGYVDVNSHPENIIETVREDETFDIIKANRDGNDELQLLDGKNMLSMIKKMINETFNVNITEYESNKTNSEIICSGNVILNDVGEAIVQLPKYKLYMDKNEITYQLTAIGNKCPDLHIKKEIYNKNNNHEFVIGGGNMNDKISWQIIKNKVNDINI